MVFWRYTKDNKDMMMWLSPEKFEFQNERDQKRAIKRLKEKPGSHAADKKRFLKNNPSYQKDYQKKRQQNDPLYVIAHRCRATIQSIIRRRGWKRICKTNEMLGCDWETLKLHLEHSFLKGMSWDNRELWDIDHYHPLGAAKSMEEVVKLNHYTNLRPMWKKDNAKKSDSLCHKGHQIPLLLQ